MFRVLANWHIASKWLSDISVALLVEVELGESGGQLVWLRLAEDCPDRGTGKLLWLHIGILVPAEAVLLTPFTG